MKKQLLIVMILLGVVVAANAQLKVNTNGNISIQSTTTPLSPLSINCQGNVEYAVAIQGNTSGMYCYGNGDNSSSKIYGGEFYSVIGNTHHCVGIKGVAGNEYATGQNNKIHMGLIGIGGGGKRNVGVFGQTKGTGKGASIYGTTYSSDSASPLDYETQNFAGYFRGDVKVTGNLQVNGSIQGILLGGSSSNYSLDNLSKSRTNILENFSCLSTSTYKTTKPVVEKVEDDFYENEEIKASLEDVEKEQNIIEDQYYTKSHYALSANELEIVFPDLVYQKEDGSKGINYIEMIPLLVQSINELQSQVNELKGVDDNAHKAPKRAASSDYDEPSDISVPKPYTSKLYQNTPNPFTERTEIRFSLPDDARNAYIYIFDMQGKMLRQIPVDASMQSVTINGYELSAGIYLYSLAVNGQEIDTKRMILSK